MGGLFGPTTKLEKNPKTKEGTRVLANWVELIGSSLKVKLGQNKSGLKVLMFRGYTNKYHSS